MIFPASPTNGQQVTISNVVYQYNSSKGVWDRIGLTNPAGYTGSIGYTGSSGVGYTGSAGTNGYTGSAGVDGYTGSLGYSGSIGYTGSIGVGYTGSGSGTVSFVAAGTIPTGEVVVLKSDGTVTTAVETTAASFGTATQLGTGLSNYEVSGVYDSANQKVIVAYDDGLAKVAVGTVSGNTISFGTPVTFGNASGSYFNAVYHPSSGKTIIFFSNNQGGNPTARIAVVTVSGTSATVATTTVSANYYAYISGVLDAASGNIVYAFADIPGSATKCLVVSYSGSLSYGSVTTVASGYNSVSTAYNSSISRTLIARSSSSPNSADVYICTVSGTTITIGSANNFYASYGKISIAYDSVNNKLLVVYDKQNAGTIYYKLGTFSGSTSITFGTEVNTNLVASGYGGYTNVIFNPSSVQYILSYSDSSSSNRPTFVPISANSLVFGTAIRIGSATQATALSPIIDTGNNKIVSGWSSSSEYFKFAVYLPPVTTVQLNSNNYLGISAGTYQAGNTAIINSAGTVSNVSASGLTIGSVYYVSSVDGSLTTTPTSVVAGLAVGTNKILVKQKGDTGYTGSTGSVGYTGSAGSSGTIGYTGSTGTGYTGSIGYSGSLGYSGSSGYTGSFGYTGSLGYAGSFGYTGSLGYTGSQGVGYTGSAGTGYTGSAGAQGVIGYTGSAGTGGGGGGGYTGSQGLPGTLASGVVTDSFTGNGVQVAFSLSVAPLNENQTIVNIDGVTQQRSSYSVSGYTLTLDEAPLTGEVVEVTTLAYGATNFVTRNYTGDGSTTTYTVTNGVTADALIISINGVIQRPTTDYTVSTTSLIFVEAPGNGDVITVREIPTGGIGGTSIYSRTSITATAGQTSFAVAYNIGFLSVYFNGALLNAVDYTATNGSTVVLTDAAVAGDIVEFITYNAVPVTAVPVATFNSTNLTANLAITAGYSAVSVGPISVADGVTISIASGQKWVIL